MYKIDREPQISFTDFNQPLGLKMNEENRWIKKAERIPWESIEDEYAKLFPSKTGMPAKPLRMALGSLLIQKQYSYSDEELVEQIRENPYYQYFIGMAGYEDKIPFVPSLLVEFRKRLSGEILEKINEMIIEYNIQEKQTDEDEDENNEGNGNKQNEEEHTCPTGTKENEGTLILDATCAPQNIKYPQDIELLNEAREKTEHMIDKICEEHKIKKPRMYRQVARIDYLEIAKSKKRGTKKILKAIKKQIQYLRRDLGYIDKFLEEEHVVIAEKEKEMLKVIRKVLEQQTYMYENKTHRVEDRIVSISQPYIRPIVRGKAKAPTEFGAKIDMSIDEHGAARVEKFSFDPYNESCVLQVAVENYRKRTGHYPEKVLVDQIYRNRINIKFCKECGIRLSGKPLGRPKKNPDADKKIEYKDNIDRIAVERKFSLAKHKFGLGLLRTKLAITTKASIVLSIIAMNVDRFVSDLFAQILLFLYRLKFCALLRTH